MQVLGSRRGGLDHPLDRRGGARRGGAFAVWQLIERPSVDEPLPGPGSAVSEARPQITFAVPDRERLGDLRVGVDGVDVTSRVRGVGRAASRDRRPSASGRDALGAGQLLQRQRLRPLGRRASWDFDVNTTAPKRRASPAGPGTLRARRAVKFAGTAEPGAGVIASPPAAQPPRPRPTPRAPGRPWPACPRAACAATVTATDAAGNTTVRERALTVDTTAPELALSAPATGAQHHRDRPAAGATGTIASDDPRALTFSAAVNGKPWPR